MIRFLSRRLLTAALTLLVTTAATFCAVSAAPGDFLTEARINPQISPSATRALELRYGLNSSLATRYWTWLKGAVHGDWGESYNTGLPVSKLISDSAGATFWLVTITLLLAWSFCLALSWLVYANPGSLISRSMDQFATLVLSIPDIVLVLAVAWLFARLGLDLSSGPAAWLALFLGLVPSLFLQVKSAFVQADSLPFMQAARDRRLGQSMLIFRYLLPAAAPSLAGLLALSIGAALSSSLLVECTLARPGLGNVLLEAILARDAAVVTAGVAVSTLIWIVGNLLSELLQFAADPRLRVSS